MLNDLLKSKDIKSIKQMRREIKQIVEEVQESTEIQIASTKLLGFYVNDMLSLAQINSSKFRKDCSNIDIRKSIQEIIMIQKHKAETMGIDIHAEYLNF